ncbi:PH domain-containing protein [Isobaculum melis]|uniref:PH domain-containing protein n=1 Tax=Isobaculum melis TaxID=142588 RepID=A0A1H9UIC2_9LACT|nr:PH domain-containing protein [Isobaculum melis]SES09215.1 PH domain-containing protein [Isobaculum melis]
MIDKKNKKLVNKLMQADPHINPTEKIYEAVLGTLQATLIGTTIIKKGIFIATDQNLYFFRKYFSGYECEVFPYEEITFKDIGNRLSGHRIIFYANHTKIVISQIKSGDIKGFMERLEKQTVTEANENLTENTYELILDEEKGKSIVEYLKALKELVEMDIVTQEDFNEVKKKTLGLPSKKA